MCTHFRFGCLRDVKRGGGAHGHTFPGTFLLHLPLPPPCLWMDYHVCLLRGGTSLSTPPISTPLQCFCKGTDLWDARSSPACQLLWSAFACGVKSQSPLHVGLKSPWDSVSQALWFHPPCPHDNLAHSCFAFFTAQLSCHLL